MDPSVVTGAGTSLLNNGVLGAFAVLMVAAIVFLVRRILSDADRTRIDTKEMVDAMRAAAVAANDTRAAIELATRAQTDSNAYRQEVATALKGLREAVVDAVESGRRDREDIRRLLIERTKVGGQ